MQTRSAPARRRRCASTATRALLLVELLLLKSSSSSAQQITTTGSVAPSSQCTVDRTLLAGTASCSPPCNDEGTAACIALRSGTDVCTSMNTSISTAGCPLMEANNCVYQCLPWVETTQNDTFVFYVTPSVGLNRSETDAPTLWQNQRYVDSIGALDLPERIKYVSLIGGSSVREQRIVDVRVALALSGSNVTNLTLANLNLAKYLTSPPSIRVTQSPPKLQSLSIINCKLTALPVDTSSLKTLISMDLPQNEMVSFSRNYSSESLLHLNLSSNSLTSFDATFPSLQSLDLSKNQFKSIPSNVFLFPKLKTLDVSGNPLADPTLTQAQYWFLNNLTSLSIGGFTNELVCKQENQQLLKAQVVCVMESTDLLVLSKSSLTWYIVIPIVATAIISIGAFALWYSRRKKHHAKRAASHRISTKNTTGPLTHGEGGDEFVLLDELEVSNGEHFHKIKSVASAGSLWADEELLACQLRYEDIEEVKQIGMGAFAVVWLVTYRQTRLLASKRLVKDQVNRKKTHDFVAEIKLNAQLDHPSIVQFVGAAWTVEADLQALFEYMANGDLRGYLDSTRHDASCRQWNHMKLQIAIEIAEALVYVHSFTPPLVHRDLKSKNVLLDDDMKANLSDFGVSRFASENGTMTAGVGTGKWLAPEVLAGGHDYDQMCDIYSLGVVLSELDTHALPYEELNQADVATLQLVLAGSVRPRFSDQCPIEIRELADRCLSFEPNQRPSAMEIAFTLRTFAKTLEEGDQELGNTSIVR